MTWAVLTYLDIICHSAFPVTRLDLKWSGVALCFNLNKYDTQAISYHLLWSYALLFSWSRLKRSVHGGCYSKVGLPLIENSSIVEQPLDLWTLTEQYRSTATRIIHNARYNTAAKVQGSFICHFYNTGLHHEVQVVVPLCHTRTIL